MPDETPPAPEPVVPQSAEQAVELGEFSPENLGKSLDKVFPATSAARRAGAPEAPIAPAAPTTPTAPAPPTAPAAPVPVAEPVHKPILPEELFGEIPKPTEAAAPEVLAEVDAPEHIKSNPAALKNWQQLRGGYEQRGKELEKIRAELTETKSKLESGIVDEGLKARLGQLEQENQQYRERQISIDLQGDPEFQKVFVQGRRQLVETAADIMRQAGLDPSTYATAAELSGKARTDAFDQIIESVESTTLRGELTTEISKLNSLDRSKAQNLANAPKVLEKLHQDQRAREFKALQEHDKFLTSTFDTVFDKLANVSKIGFLRKIDGNDEWNSKVDAIANDAREIVKNSTDYSQLTGTVILGRAFPDVYNAAVALNRENAELKKTIAEYKASEPSLNGGRTGDSVSATRPDQKLSFADAVAQGSGLR